MVDIALWVKVLAVKLGPEGQTCWVGDVSGICSSWDTS